MYQVTVKEIRHTDLGNSIGDVDRNPQKYML